MLNLSLKTVEYLSEAFEKKLQGYKVEEYFLDDLEKVLIVEDSLVIYIGIHESAIPFCENTNELFKSVKNNSFLNITRKREKYYELYIEELVYNTLGWKYNHTKFVKEMEKDLQIQNLKLDVHYTKFRGYNRIYWCPKEATLAEKINEQLPELKLKERYEIWEGIQYYFIVLEVQDIKGNIEYGVAYTTQKPYDYVMNKCKLWIARGFCSGDIRMYGQNLIQALESWKRIKRQTRLEEYFTYFYFEKKFREKDDAWRYADTILEAAYNNKFSNKERSTYTRPVNRWKTEETVYNVTKKLFSDYKVIYQYRPFFLKSKKGGQLSYDVFISGLNIAIEYQGKQHFEPIEFFGGKEAYEKNIERDKEKYDLSIQHGIKLIYLNYWENITPKLIREKVEEVL